MAQFKLLSVIIPVFNEKNTVIKIIEKVRAVKLNGIRKEILLVDDASTDGTTELLNKINFPNLKKFHHEKNRGKGAAIRTAIPHTKGDFILIQDADLEYDPDDYSKILNPLVSGDADVVFGSRFLGPRRVFLFWHFVGNRLLTLITNVLYNTNLTDMETCYKVFQGDILRSIRLRSNRFNFEPEISAKILKKKYRIYEVPITYKGRNFEEGKKITWRDGIVALMVLFYYKFFD
jgi:glycosyltransferase involved in cell wall biosynthesis